MNKVFKYEILTSTKSRCHFERRRREEVSMFFRMTAFVLFFTLPCALFAIVTPTQSELSLAVEHFLEGKENFLKLKLDAAILKLKSAQSLFYKNMNALTEGESLFQAHIYLALCYFTQNEPSQAKDEIQKALRLNFKKELNEKRFAPNFIQFFKKTKKAYLKDLPTTRLEVHSAPAFSKVYVNGFEMGFTPLHLEKWPAGDHTLRLIQEGYEIWTQKISISSKAPSPIQAKLKKLPPIPSISQKPLSKSDTPQQNRLTWLKTLEDKTKMNHSPAYLKWIIPVATVTAGILTYRWIQGKKEEKVPQQTVLQVTLP